MLIEKGLDSAVVSVGGVGFQVGIPVSTLQALPAVGQPVQLGRARAPRSIDDLIPPADIGDRTATSEAPPREKNFFEKLFGG